mgnify:CR=1 FL=1
MLRIVISFVVAFAAAALGGKGLIPLLRRMKAGQSIKEIGPTWHMSKQGTPTMGGLMFIIGSAAAVLLLGWPDFAAGRFGGGFVLLFALVFGVIGYLLKLYKYNVVPIVLGLILGPIAEAGLSQALLLNNNSISAVFTSMVTRPICIVLFLCMVISVSYPYISQYRAKKKSQTS